VCAFVFIFQGNHYTMLFFHDHSHLWPELDDQQFRSPRPPLHQGINFDQSLRVADLPPVVNAHDELQR